MYKNNTIDKCKDKLQLHEEQYLFMYYIMVNLFKNEKLIVKYVYANKDHFDNDNLITRCRSIKYKQYTFFTKKIV